MACPHVGDIVAFGLEVVSKNLAHATGDGAHLNAVRHVDTVWDAPFGLLEPLSNKLSGAVDVDLVVKVDVDGRESQRGERTNLLHPGDAAHRRFRRTGDELFNLFRCHPIDFSEDLDQVWADVGERINGQLG